MMNDADPNFDSWSKLLGSAAGVLGITGILVYGVLITGYEEFYSELGLLPSDVGISYGKALGGTAALSVLGIVVFSGFIVLLAYLVSLRKRNRGPRYVSNVVFVLMAVATLMAFFFLGFLAGVIALLAVVLVYRATVSPCKRYRDLLTIGASIALTWLALSTIVALFANYQADLIKDGAWVKPPEVSRLPLLGIRAFPVEVYPADASMDNTEEGIGGGNFRYLGRAEGMAVVYDVSSQRALF